MTDSECVIVITTLDLSTDAHRFATTLVEERLAACIHVHGPMRSTYWWKGAVHEDEERQVVIKTTRGRLEALLARVRTLHPYEVPELVCLPADASPDYGRWVVESVAPAE